MTVEEKNRKFVGGMDCPLCGLHMMDLAHDGYECGDPDYHDYHCTECHIDFTVEVIRT